MSYMAKILEEDKNFDLQRIAGILDEISECVDTCRTQYQVFNEMTGLPDDIYVSYMFNTEEVLKCIKTGELADVIDSSDLKYLEKFIRSVVKRYGHGWYTVHVPVYVPL